MEKYRNQNPGSVIDGLRSDGYKVFVSHRRPLKNNRNVLYSRREMIEISLNLNDNWDVCGGITAIWVYGDDQDLLAHSLAVCGKRDAFSKKRGLTIALGRVLEALETSVPK